MKKHFFSLYSPNYPKVLVALLQSSHYHERIYLKKLWKKKNYSYHRGSLSLRRNSRILLIYTYLGILLEIIAGIVLIYLGATNHVSGGIFFGLALIILYPFIWSHLILLPVYLRNTDIALSETGS